MSDARGEIEMPRKSANMLRAGKHTVLVDGKPHKIENIERDGATVVIHLANGDVIRRSPGAKLEIK